MSIHWMPALPLGAIALILMALLGLLAHGSFVLVRKRLPRRWIVFLGFLRLAIVFVFAICLLQPSVTLRRTVQEGPPTFVLLDTSKSMGTTDASAGLSRLAETVRWLEQSGLQAGLAARPNVRWFAFDAHVRNVTPDEVKSLEANGEGTHYAESLTDAWEHWRQNLPNGVAGIPGGRVLLVSDGNDSDPRDAAHLARQLGLVVDTLAPVAAAPGAKSPQVTLVHLQAPRRILLGAESRLAVTLRQQGLSQKPLQVRLKDGDKLVAAQPFTFATNQDEKTVSVAFRPEEAGLKEYTVEIEGASAAAPHFSVQVVGARNEVLFLEDTWRWEFKFLRRIFEDDPGFALTAFLSRGESAFVELAEPDRRTQVHGLPQSRAELTGFDTLVLGSIEPRRWPRGFAEALRQLVEEDGKSLVVIAGPNLRQMLDQPALAALLPVELSHESANPLPGPVALRVTAEGLGTPFFATPGSTPASFWSSLPAVDQIYPALRKKPAATALVEAAQLANPFGNLVVMAEHTIGRGRVLYVGTDTLWKWQMLASAAEGPTPYQVFWQQALRTLAPIRQSTGNVNLNLQPDHSRAELGQTVTLRAEVESARPLPRVRIQSQVTLPDGKQLPLSFAPDATEPGVYVARFDPPRAGQHKVSATVVIDDKPAADTLVAFDVIENAGEISGQRVNEANLARISQETGGHFIDRADPATWRALQTLEKVPVQRLQTIDLWNGSALLILLCALLGVDWLLRLLRGFA